jgi:hypothetical protein
MAKYVVEIDAFQMRQLTDERLITIEFDPEVVDTLRDIRTLLNLVVQHFGVKVE